MNKKQKEIVRSLAMVTQLGISLLAPIVLCAAFGNWLDHKFGWSVTAVLLILGVMAGARNAWMLVKDVAESSVGSKPAKAADTVSEHKGRQERK